MALLSFDVDGPTGLINRNPEVERLPSTFSIGEYGPAVAAPRILALLRKYEIRASFFIPGWIAERHAALVEHILRDGHEVGHHGYLHEPPASLTPEQEAEVLDRATAVLERLSGEPPMGYRSPSWELSPHSLDLLAARGFVYDSSLMGADRPYWVGPPERRLVEIPVHWSLDDYPYFTFSAADRSRLMATPQHVYDVWAAAFDELAARGDPFVLTMHPHVIGRPGRLQMLEQLIRHIRSQPQVRFERAIDVARAYAQGPSEGESDGEPDREAEGRSSRAAPT